MSRFFPERVVLKRISNSLKFYQILFEEEISQIHIYNDMKHLQSHCNYIIKHSKFS